MNPKEVLKHPDHSLQYNQRAKLPW